MNGILGAYSRILLIFKRQNNDVRGKCEAPKTKLLSSTPKYNFEIKLKSNHEMFSYILFSLAKVFD